MFALVVVALCILLLNSSLLEIEGVSRTWEIIHPVYVVLSEGFQFLISIRVKIDDFFPFCCDLFVYSSRIFVGIVVTGTMFLVKWHIR